jgi:hypothetical protein
MTTAVTTTESPDPGDLLLGVPHLSSPVEYSD